MEEKELKANDIPCGYPLCFNNACGKKDTCMHYQAMLLKRGECSYGSAVYPTAWQNGKCECYREKKRVQKAWGFSQLYRNVNRYRKSEARQSVSSFFGRGNGPYYRAHHGELLLTPKQQEAIMNIIAQFGPTEDVKFDHYVTAWDFDY